MRDIHDLPLSPDGISKTHTLGWASARVSIPGELRPELVLCNPDGPYARWGKRAVDVVIASILSLLVLPWIPLVSLPNRTER